MRQVDLRAGAASDVERIGQGVLAKRRTVEWDQD
jgi:hypothetical protein